MKDLLWWVVWSSVGAVIAYTIANAEIFDEVRAWADKHLGKMGGIVGCDFCCGFYVSQGLAWFVCGDGLDVVMGRLWTGLALWWIGSTWIKLIHALAALRTWFDVRAGG